MKELIRRLTATPGDWGLTVARLTLAGVIFPHGAQKLLGWWGGYGFEASMQFFTQQVGVPAVLGLAAILAESVGALVLALGLLSRLSALAVGATMFVAMLFAGVPNGFFMNWFGTQKGEGMEFFLLTLGLALITVLRGGGALSLDQVIARRLSGAKAAAETGDNAARPAMA